MNTQQRNEAARLYVLKMLNTVAVYNESKFQKLPSYSKVNQTLTNLIFQSAMGFRGVVATALTGMHLNSAYQPLTDFYGCNPRSIFEQGIFYALREKQIPCGKSDPLNVAKNQSELTYAWARGKRPQAAAEAVVDYLQYLESLSHNDRQLAIEYFFFTLLKYGEHIASISTAFLPVSDTVSSQELALKLTEFLTKYPESGTVPQKIIAVLLDRLYEHSAISVHGGDESVFGTNTTSKKPADIWLSREGQVFNLFEVTVKKIDVKRLDDALDSLLTMGLADLPLTFICRLPMDISSLDTSDKTLLHRGKLFNFVDIHEFISIALSQLHLQSIETLLLELTEFINLHDRPITTKEGWNSVMGR